MVLCRAAKKNVVFMMESLRKTEREMPIMHCNGTGMFNSMYSSTALVFYKSSLLWVKVGLYGPQY